MLLVNTNGSVWVQVDLINIRNMILHQLEQVETIFSDLGVEVITPEQMKTVEDTDNVAIGHGLWTLNRHLRTPFVNVSNAQDFLMCDTKLGIALGFASSYSGGGAMRVPEVNEVSYSRLTAGSIRRCVVYEWVCFKAFFSRNSCLGLWCYIYIYIYLGACERLYIFHVKGFNARRLSLRFSNGPLGGRCAIAYDYTK